MKYISGMPALNLPCSLDTTGDWHHSCYDWTKVPFCESDGSILGDWGIERQFVRERGEWCNVANTLRACLDLMEDGLFSLAGGMKEDYIANDIYTKDIFEQAEKLIRMSDEAKGREIDRFLEKEYELQWLDYKRNR